MPLHVTLDMEGTGWDKTIPDVAARVKKIVTYTLRAEGWGRRSATVDVTLSTDARVRRLNKDWRGKDKPTNVLSFPLESPDVPVPQGRSRHLGDLVLARQTLVREAKEQAKPIADHLTHLLVHGTLHLLGYDHETEVEALLMEQRETELLARLGIPDPYA